MKTSETQLLLDWYKVNGRILPWRVRGAHPDPYAVWVSEIMLQQTRVEAVIPYLDKCDMVLVMTVEPGFGGQKFMADMMPKMKKIREMLDEVNPSCIIEVDGGVDANTCAVCKENGAEVLVAGSAYFKATDRAEFVKTIQK
mgnify:CR=1 FL=1